MKPEDQPRFGVELALVAEVFGEALSPAKIDAYFEDLADFDIEHVRAALRECRRCREFFPRPVHVREIASRLRGAERRALSAKRGPLALPDPTERESIRTGLRGWIDRLTAQFGGSHRVEREPTHDELIAHERSKGEALIRFREHVASAELPQNGNENA